MLSMSKPVMPVPPKRSNSQPPTTAPTMPSRMSTTVPSPVVLTILLAIRPSPSPSRIHTIVDMRHSSAMNQHRDLGMREYLDRLAAKEDRGDAVAAVPRHDDKVTGFRIRVGCRRRSVRFPVDHGASA